jgi:hypothetical protein
MESFEKVPAKTLLGPDNIKRKINVKNPNKTGIWFL